MNNKNSSRGHVFDLINSIANDLAIVNHLTEAIYARESQLKDEPNNQELTTKIDNYKDLLAMTLDNRRDKMNHLKEMAGEDYDDKMWCALKHASESYMESMEVWQADENEQTYQQMIKSTSVLAGALSLFMGMDFEPCARCLQDGLKHETNKDIEIKEI